MFSAAFLNNFLTFSNCCKSALVCEVNFDLTVDSIVLTCHTRQFFHVLATSLSKHLYFFQVSNSPIIQLLVFIFHKNTDKCRVLTPSPKVRMGSSITYTVCTSALQAFCSTVKLASADWEQGWVHIFGRYWQRAQDSEEEITVFQDFFVDMAEVLLVVKDNQGSIAIFHTSFYIQFA